MELQLAKLMLEFWSRSKMTVTFPVQIIVHWQWGNEKKQIVLHGLAVLSGCRKLANVKRCWPNPEAGRDGVSYFPYILLNEIPTMFSQLAKRSARFLPADLCTDDIHYVKNHRSTVLRRNNSMAVEVGTVSLYYVLVTRNFVDVAFETWCVVFFFC